MEFVSDVCNCAFLLCVTTTVCNCKLCNSLNEWALICVLLALCYVVAKSLLVGFMSIYSLLYSHERGQTFIQFLRANCYVYCQWVTKQLFTNTSLCMWYRNTHPLGFALEICASMLHINLRIWSKAIT